MGAETGREATVFFVDDDPRAGELMARFCAAEPLACRVFQDPARALAAYDRQGADLVVTDLRMPGMTGIDLLRALRERDAELPVIVITAYSSVEDAIQALRLGAADFVKKPYDPEELLVQIRHNLERVRLRRENRLLRRELRERQGTAGLLGESAAMAGVRRMIAKLAEVRCNVIIQGESGTGKELAARAIHDQGPEADAPFVVIDCGALTETLLESELFGHEKGAFTGAAATRRGLLEQASGGTVFLDEIGNISDALQTKLLRVIQEQQVVRVGGGRPIPIDVRFIAATHRDLEAMVAAGEFRHDLYHRLQVVTLRLPPLRERREDIPLLVRHFTAQFAARYGRQVDGFDPASLERLCTRPWPGNVRELRNVVERHIALADGPVLRLEDHERAPEPELDADQPSLAELERRYILRTLRRCGGSRERTAAALGINKSTLWRKLRQYRQDADGQGPGKAEGDR